MVGKMSDDRMMSGSRIPVLYLWKYENGHPWSTPNDELRKSIDAKHGRFERTDTLGEPGVCGNLLENVIVENACEELGLPEPTLSPPVIKKPHYQISLDGLTVAPAPVRIFANQLIEIDGGESSIELSGTIPIECKVTGDYRQDDVPLYRGVIQLQAQMMAVNADFGVLVTLHRGIERHIKIYRKNAMIQDRILELCEDFNARVASENYYPPVNVDDASKTHPTGDGSVELPGIADRVERLVRLRESAKEIEVEIDALQTEIMSEMRDAEIARVGSYVVKWPMRHYKAQPEKVAPAKDARTVRLKTLQIAH